MYHFGGSLHEYLVRLPNALCVICGYNKPVRYEIDYAQKVVSDCLQTALHSNLFF